MIERLLNKWAARSWSNIPVPAVSREVRGLTPAALLLFSIFEQNKNTRLLRSSPLNYRVDRSLSD